MRTLTLSSIITSFFYVALMPAWATTDGWQQDYDAAKVQADKEQKDIFLFFTGLSWCPPCKALHKEVLSKKEFIDKAAEKFVLVELDYPHDVEGLDPKKEELAQLYSVQAFPTVILTDSVGRPYGQTSYQEGGVEDYLKHLDGIIKQKTERDTTLREAAALEGEEKADKLTEFLGGMPSSIVMAFYEKELAELTKANPESPFLKELKFNDALSRLEQEIGKLQFESKHDEMLAKVDAFLEEHKPEGEMQQQVLMLKVAAYVESGEEQKAFEQIDAISAIDPDSDIAIHSDLIKEEIRAYIEAQQQGKEDEADGNLAEEDSSEDPKESEDAEGEEDPDDKAGDVDSEANGESEPEEKSEAPTD